MCSYTTLGGAGNDCTGDNNHVDGDDDDDVRGDGDVNHDDGDNDDDDDTW